ncbi:restriction endonuclease subunit S [Ectopseudomonas hydrolytica]|uniref:restriction endonuclease subunit S n=1 Tax=Ectopseudomonas hydrolytica TaxID=2493633 RepID=UPI003C30A6DC
MKPQEWGEFVIDELCETIIDCVNKTAPVVDFPTPYKMIRTTNVRDGWISLNSVKYVDHATYLLWTRRQTPKKGDVILTREAPLGEVGMLRSDDQVFLGQRLVSYRVNPKKLDNHFLLYAFQGDCLRAQIKALGSGSTVEHMRVPDAKNLKIFLPPLASQKKIGAILAAYDDLIENNTRRIEILEEMARRLYEEWFVQFRFPGHEGVEFKESELGLIPEGWSVAAVTDVFTIKYGKTFPKTKLNPEGQYPVFGGGGMIGRCDQFNIQGPTTLITSRGNGSGTVWRASEAGLVTNNAFIVMPKEPKLNVHYGYIERALLNAPIKSFLGGSAQPQLTLDGLAGVRVLTPDPEVIQQFSALVDPFYALISRVERASANLRAQRDLLLPKLISGEIDVSDIPMPT